MATKKADPRGYKPELVTLSPQQQDVIDKYAIVADTDVGRMLVDHIQNDFINRMLFPSDKQQAIEALDMKDDYFRGMLEGMAVFSNYLRERAEMQRNPSLQTG